MIRFYTQWSTPVLEDDVADVGKHNAFVSFAVGATMQAMPDFLSFLDDHQAQVIVGQQMFSYSTPDVPNVWVDVPDMAGRLNFLPWAEAHETAH